MRANETQNDETRGIERATEAAATAQVDAREPYVAPVIEKFPPMGNVTFGTNVQPMLAMTLAGA